MDNKTYLAACDLGSSSGKIFLASSLEIEEIHRFPIEPICLGDYYYTDILFIWSEILTGLKKIVSRDIQLSSFGIDSWGVDYAYLNGKGEMISNPIHYRDERTLKTSKKLETLLSKEFLFEKTGISYMPFNTLFQVYDDLNTRFSVLKQAKHFLFLPDLIAYFLTGNISTEYTIASTSQMIDIKTKNWSKEILDKISFPIHILPKIQKTGSTKGRLSSKLASDLSCKPFPIFATASHDTASSILASPLKDENTAFLSSGSWSILGLEKKEPILSKEAFKAGFTNELGINDKIYFLKNINGLWMLQLLKKKWKLSFSEISTLARSEIEKNFSIDITNKKFYGVLDLEQTIINDFKERNLEVPKTKGQIASAIYHGLSDSYKKSLEELNSFGKNPIKKIYIVGGGSKDNLLNELTAKKTKCQIIKGVVESSALGNILIQLLSLNKINSLEEGRKIIEGMI